MSTASAIRRLRRIVLIVGVVLIVVAGLALVLLLVASQTGIGRRQVAREVERRVQAALPNAAVSIDEIGGNLLRSPSVRGLSVKHQGHTVLQARAVDVRYDLARLLRGDIVVDRIVVRDPVITVARGQDGIRLLDAFAPESRPPGPARSFAIETIVLENGRVVIGPQVDTFAAIDIPDRIGDLDGRLSLSRDGRGLHVGIAALSFEAEDPALAGRVEGGVHRLESGWHFDDLQLHTTGSSLRLEGEIENLDALGGDE